MKPEVKITLIYLLLGLLWIYFSDKIVLMFPDNDFRTLLQTVKGFVYVGFTSTVLYLLLKGFYNELNNRVKQLEESGAQLRAQNEKLQDISWMQSHVVRAPLASLMGCLHLIKDVDHTQEERETAIENILHSANELDTVIRQISQKSENLHKGDSKA